jgi:hypothetical protein
MDPLPRPPLCRNVGRGLDGRLVMDILLNIVRNSGPGLWPAVAVLLTGAFAAFSFAALRPRAELRVIVVPTNDQDSNHFILRISIANKSRVMMKSVEAKLASNESTIDPSSPESSVRVAMRESIDFGCHETILRSTRRLYPGEAISVDRLYCKTGRGAVQFGLQFKSSPSIPIRVISLFFARREQWTVTRIFEYRPVGYCPQHPLRNNAVEQSR